MIAMTEHEWRAKGLELFGKDMTQWRFVCPACGHVATPKDWHDAGAEEGAMAFSCVGRWTGAGPKEKDKPGPCNYAGGGLFKLNPVEVTFDDGRKVKLFAFDESNPRKKLLDDARHAAKEKNYRLDEPEPGVLKLYHPADGGLLLIGGPSEIMAWLRNAAPAVGTFNNE